MNVTTGTKRKQVIKAIQCAVGLVLAWAGLMTHTMSAHAQELTNEQKAFVDEFYIIAITNAAEHDIPWQVPMAQAIVESTHGTSYAAEKRHNFHGIGKLAYETDADGWAGYFTLITEFKDGHYVKHGALEHLDDPYSYLDSLLDAGYNPNKDKYRHDISCYIDGVEKYRLEQGWPTSAEVKQAAL